MHEDIQNYYNMFSKTFFLLGITLINHSKGFQGGELDYLECKILKTNKSHLKNMKATTETTQKKKDIAHPTIAVASKGPWLGTYIFHCTIEFSSNRLVTSPSTNDRCTRKLTEDAIHLMQIQSFKRFMTCISPVISTHS